MSKYSSGSGGLSAAASNYVRAKGGSGRAAATSASGRSVTASVAGFFSTISRAGVVEALRSAGLERAVGEDAHTAFAMVVNAIAPSGATLDEAAARGAVSEVLWGLYERVLADGGGIAALEALGPADVVDLIRESIVAYLYYRWLQELGLRIEMKAVTPDRAVEMEQDIRDYLDARIDLTISEDELLTTDWGGAEGRRLITALYQEAYSMLEASE